MTFSSVAKRAETVARSGVPFLEDAGPTNGYPRLELAIIDPSN